MNIILSIKPKWAEKIYSGEKTIEWRKNVPKEDFIDKVFLYETAPVFRITGCFTYDHYYSLVFKNNPPKPDPTAQVLIDRGCVPLEDLDKYRGKHRELFAWKFIKVVKFEHSKSLEEFGLKRPPQSWQYIEEEKTPF